MEIKKFENGATLIYEKSSSTRTSAIYVYIRVGSINETDENRGASHFIEHLCFKGTTKLPTAREIFKEYDEIGAVFNAFTEKDHTAFYVHCADEYFDNSLHILSDIMLNSKFREKDFHREMPVMMEEMIRAADDDETTIFDELCKELYKGTPFSEPVDSIEYHKTSTPYSYKPTVDYYRKYYRPENMYISVVTNQSFQHVCDVLHKTYFMKPTKLSKISHTECVQRSFPSHGKMTPLKILRRPGLQTCHLSIAFRTCSHDHPDRFPLNLLSQIVGGSMGSRMFMRLREDNGLTYTSNCSTDYYTVNGEWVMYAQLNPDKLIYNRDERKSTRKTRKISTSPGVFPILIDIIADIVKNGVKEAEVENVKGNLRGKLIMQEESSPTVASYNGLQVCVYGDLSPVLYKNIYKDQYHNVTIADINRVAKRYLDKENMIVMLLCPNKMKVPEKTLGDYVNKVNG